MNSFWILIPLLIASVGCSKAAGKAFLSELLINVGIAIGIAAVGVLISFLSGKK